MSLVKHKHARPLFASRGQTGFTLIEVLVAAVIVSIGLLALARLQGVGVHNNYVSHLHSIASIYTENMADMMRANMAGVNANDYASGAAPATVDYATIDPAVDPAIDCRPDIVANPPAFTGTNTACTPAEQAQVDAYFWISALSDALPDGTGTVLCNDSDSGTDADPCTDGSTHTIRVSWNEKDLEQGAIVPKTFSTVFRP